MARDKSMGAIVLLLVCGSILLGMSPTEACPQFCYEAAYMTCPSSGSTHISPSCNCCLAPQVGCKIYYSDGTLICTKT
ncbi:putative proteinase inhibitor I20 [Rosa chinensis]|uniref:Uncharacterized protein n=1 Tax=Rosa chinensis TaxID=74649 RepID=A0A2P6PEW5_ROSCH|nr:putative proteinase inhibitor I20 [Rosa chinensis]